MRTMYLHSLQSFIWNQVASHRISLGQTPQPGDFVLADEHPTGTLNESDLLVSGADAKKVGRGVERAGRRRIGHGRL
jgi:tRNA(Glu) U13 pseudouridine synthase TruD